MNHIPKTPEQRKQKLIKSWENYQRESNFETEDDIPEIPVLSKEEMEKYVWPKLFQYGAIPIDKLIVGHKYLGHCRNAHEAIWKENNKFEYLRYKFGCEFPQKINHFQDDNGDDVFVPIKDLGMV